MILTEQNLKENEKLSSKEEIAKDYPCINNFLEFFKGHYIITKSDKNVYRVYLFTDNYEYVIVLFEEWCGAFTELRKHGIMESWNRGDDLYDGKPSEELFNLIALDMLRNELISLGNIEFNTFSEVYGKHIEESINDLKEGLK